MPQQGGCFGMGQAALSGPVAVDEERLKAAARNSAEKQGEQKEK